MIYILLIILIINQALLIKRGAFSCLGCGLLGYSGEIDCDPLKIKMLYLYNEQRGTDSCGLYVEPKGKKSNLIKKVGKASTLLVPEVSVESNFLIGHTRKTTIGGTLLDNAHPYQYSNLVGAHNGGITNYITLADSRDVPSPNYWVDSQALYLCMEKDKGYIKTLEDYEGGAALLFTIHDEQAGSFFLSNKLYAYRDNEKPLYHGRIRINGKLGTYISSIKESLEAIGCSKIREFPINMVHVFENGKLLHTEKITRKPIKYQHTTHQPHTYSETSVVEEEGISNIYDKHRNSGVWQKRRDESLTELRERNALYDPYYTASRVLTTGTVIEPSHVGKILIGSFVKHVKKACVTYSDYIGKTVTIKILEVHADVPKDKVDIGDFVQDVKMEYFIEFKEVEPNEADVKLDDDDDVCEIVPAKQRQEKEFKCTDFDDVRDQFWATLITIREKAKKLHDDEYYELKDNIEDLNKFIENEIYTMFSHNL